MNLKKYWHFFKSSLKIRNQKSIPPQNVKKKLFYAFFNEKFRKLT